MENSLTYTAIMQLNGDSINFAFPEFGNIMTCASINDDYIAVCQDFLGLVIAEYQDSGKELPKINNNYGCKISENQKIVYINVWMPYQRSKIKETYIKKTLTIPTWLNILAKEKNVNFSALLTKALKEELKIQN